MTEQSKSKAVSRWPRGLPYIVANEAAERYSFYGMKGILVVFMTTYLMDHSGEFDLMTGNEANFWYHMFVMGVYFTPLFGAVLSDVFLGKYRTIISLSLVYCLGHFVLAIDQTRLGLMVGLGLIAIGAGGIKPCVSAHLGDQFDESNQNLLEKAYSWFYFAINIGSFLSYLLGALFLDRYGPHLAFGVPGVLMLIATIVFWIGRKSYVSMPAVGAQAYTSVLFSKEGLGVLRRLIPIYVLVAAFWALYDQTGSSWIIQANSDFVNKRILGFEWLPAQVQAINPIMILTLVPLFTFAVYPAIEKLGIRVTSLRKIGTGLFLTAASFAIIGWIEARVMQGVTVSIAWQVLAYAVLTVAEILLSLTCLEFSYTQAPNSMKSIIMGLYFASFALGNFFTAQVNHFMQDPVVVEQVAEGPTTLVHLGSDVELLEARKFMIEGQSGLSWVREEDTVRLQGTFAMLAVNPEYGSFTLADVNSHEPVQTIGLWEPTDKTKVYVNTLVGSGYFRFFTILMLIAGVLFVPMAMLYRGKTFLQDHKQAEAV